MKKIVLQIILLAFVTTGRSQSLLKYPVGRYGISINMPAKPTTIDSLFADSSDIFIAKSKTKKFAFTARFEKYAQLMLELNEFSTAEENVKQRLEMFKSEMRVRESSGYKTTIPFKDKKDLACVSDVWRDADNNYIVVKGYSDRKKSAYLFITGKLEIDKVQQDLFFNSLKIRD